MTSERSITRSPSEYVVGPPGAGDEGRILALLRMTVGETVASKKTAEFWQWKHVSSPFGPSYSVCAWDQERATIVGLRTLMSWCLRDQHGRDHRAARAVDTATHPEHQRRGIFTRLTRVAIEDLRDGGTEFIFNTPNDQSLPGYIKMGWNRVERWSVYARPVDWISVTGKLLFQRRRIDAPVVRDGRVSDALTGWNQFRDIHSGGLAELVRGHEERRLKVGYRTERDLAYLDWRYGQHPDIDYGVHAVSDTTGLRAVIVAREVSGAVGLRAMLITEMFLRDPTPKEGEHLIRSLILASRCDYVVAHFADGTVERQALAGCRFFRAPRRGYTFAVRPLLPVVPDPTRADMWDLTLGELEIF